MEERRKHPRVQLVVKVTNRATKEFHYFYSRDVSLGGIFLETQEPYGVGTNVELDFFVPLKIKKERIIATGTVVRVIGEDAARGMGVKFDELPPESIRALSQYIKTIVGENSPEETST